MKLKVVPRFESCPFCGEEIELKISGYLKKLYVTCIVCEARGPSGGDTESAVYQWGNRYEDEEMITGGR